MTTPYFTTAEITDRAAIIELIGRLVLVLDARDWDSLGELFTDTVYSDRTSLLGGDPVTVSRSDFVAGRDRTRSGPPTGNPDPPAAHITGFR